MPAIKLKKVTAEYLAEKEKEEKSKEKARKTLEEVAQEGNEVKDESKKNEDTEDEKPHNFLDVEILYDKRKRTIPLQEQRLLDWLDSNLVKKDNVTLPLGVLYEYYSEVCQMQGQNVVDVPLFNKYVRDRFGKMFGFQENSPYRVLIKERKINTKPKVQGETLQMKLRDVLTEVINEIGNPRQGVRFGTISKAIMQKYPAQRVDIHSNKLKHALERGVACGYMECTKGVGRCGFYRLPGEPTKEEPEEKKKDKTKKAKEEGEEREGDKKEEEQQNGEAAADTEDKSGEEKSTDDEKKEEEEKKEGEEGGKSEEEQKKKPKKRSKKKKKPVEKWVYGAVERHSNPEKFEDVFPLAITYQSDPKIASGGKIKEYILKYYHEEVSSDRLKKALEKGMEKGMWECVSGKTPNGRFHLLVETFNPGRSDKLKDKIAQAIVACNEPKQASAVMLKKYIAQYHPKLNIENRMKSFKHALERSCEKGNLRQLSGIGTTGTFQLTTQFSPSPAILAGDTSDSEEEEEPDLDREEPEYVPRPTKHGRLALKPKTPPISAPQHAKKNKPKPQPPKKAISGRARVAKASKPKYYEVTSESESEGELKVEYMPTPSKSRGGGTAGTKAESLPKETKSSAKGRDKPVSAQKKTSEQISAGKSKRRAAKSPAIVDVSGSEESDVGEKSTAEYTPRPSKSRGGGGMQTPATKSSAKPKGSVKRKLMEEADADDESDNKSGPITPVKKGRPGRTNTEKKSYAEVDDKIEGAEEEMAPSPSKKKKVSSTGKPPVSGRRK